MRWFLAVASVCAACALASVVVVSVASGSPPVRVVYCGNGSLSEASALFVPRTGGILGAVIGYPPAAEGVDTVSVSGGSVRALPVYVGNGPVLWSHDGSFVAVHGVIGSQAAGGGPPEAPLVIANTKTRVTRTVLDAATAGLALDDWSPDDRQLLVEHYTPGQSASQPGSVGLQLVDVQTGEIRDLVPGQDGAFSPNGREIAFHASNGAIALLDLVSGRQTTLVANGGGNISWSPGGTTISYEVGVSPLQIFVIRVGANAPRLVGTTTVSQGPLVWSGNSLIWTSGSGITITNTTIGAARTIHPLPAPFEKRGLVPVGVLPGKRIVYDLGGGRNYGGYRTVSITGRNDERLLACRGKGYGDKVIGSPLNDLIDVRNGTLDTVDCKAGNDFVLADRIDHVARNCETVVRR